jgi:hypothetical protein
MDLGHFATAGGIELTKIAERGWGAPVGTNRDLQSPVDGRASPTVATAAKAPSTMTMTMTMTTTMTTRDPLDVGRMGSARRGAEPRNHTPCRRRGAAVPRRVGTADIGGSATAMINASPGSRELGAYYIAN